MFRSSPATANRFPVARWVLLVLVLLGFFSVFTGQCALDRNTSRAYDSRPLPADVEPVLLPAPPVNDEFLPCDDCHDGEITKPEVRELEDHEEVQLAHGNLWCLDCHGFDNHQKLELPDGTLIAFEDSWRLCTRCHAKKLASWRAGVHGKRTGHWRGAKEYRTCVACHRPHSPHTKTLEPKPRPPRSSEITLHRDGDREEAGGEL